MTLVSGFSHELHPIVPRRTWLTSSYRGENRGSEREVPGPTSHSTEVVEPGFETQLYLTSDHKLSPQAAKTPNPGPLIAQSRSSVRADPSSSLYSLTASPWQPLTK